MVVGSIPTGVTKIKQSLHKDCFILQRVIEATSPSPQPLSPTYLETKIGGDVADKQLPPQKKSDDRQMAPDSVSTDLVQILDSRLRDLPARELEVEFMNRSRVYSVLLVCEHGRVLSREEIDELVVQTRVLLEALAPPPTQQLLAVDRTEGLRVDLHNVRRGVFTRVIVELDHPMHILRIEHVEPLMHDLTVLITQTRHTELLALK